MAATDHLSGPQFGGSDIRTMSPMMVAMLGRSQEYLDTKRADEAAASPPRIGMPMQRQQVSMSDYDPTRPTNRGYDASEWDSDALR